MENTVSVQAIMAQVDMIKTKFASSMEEYKNNIDYAYTNVGVTSANIDSIVADIKGEVERLKTRDIVLNVGDDVKEFIAKKGFDLTYGARPLRRAIQNQIEDTVAEAFLNGDIKSGKPVKLTIKDDKVIVG